MTTVADKRGLKWDALLHRYLPLDEPVTRRTILAVSAGAVAAMAPAPAADPLAWNPGAHRYTPVNASTWDAADAGVTFDGVTDDTDAWNTLFAAIGNSQATITTIPGTSVVQNLTVPSNVTISYVAGCSIAPVVGKTLTHNGIPQADGYQIFAGAGGHALGPLASINAQSQWFGAKFDGVTDDTTAHNALAGAISAGGTWWLPGQTSLTGQVTVKTPIRIAGPGSAWSVFKAKTGATGPLLNIDLTATNQGRMLEGLSVDLTNEPAITGVSVTNVTELICKDVQVSNGTGIGFDAPSASGVCEDLVISNCSGTAGIRWDGDNGNPQLVRGRVAVAPGGTLTDGLVVNRTTDADTGGIYLESFKVNGAGGTISNGGVTVSSTAGSRTAVYLFATDLVSDGITGGEALSLKNVGGCFFANCWFTQADYTTASIVLDATADVIFTGGQPTAILLKNNAMRTGIGGGARMIPGTPLAAINFDASWSGGDITIGPVLNSGTGPFASDFGKLAKAVQTQVYGTPYQQVTDATRQQSMRSIMDGTSGKRYWEYVDSSATFHTRNDANSADRYALTDGGQLTLTGKIIAAGGYRETLDGWYQNNVAASQAAVPLSRDVSGPTDNINGWIALRAGSVTGIAIHSSAACTAGSATAIIAINGTTYGTAVLNTTNTTFKATTYVVGSTDFAFNAGDILSVKLTTSSDWAPTTANIRVSLEVQT